MSEFKGSPGPWVVVQNGFTECAVKDAQGVWLTYRAGDSNRLSNAEVEANARIMAAAPELLKALIQITDIYAEMRATLSQKYPQDGWSAETMTIDQARAAIAKATGASHE